MSERISLEQALEKYRVMNTPTEFSWKQHFVNEKFSNPNAMLLKREELDKFYNRLNECQITIGDGYKMPVGSPCQLGTLKDMLHIVIDPANEKLVKDKRKIVFSNSAGTRLAGKDAFAKWNGFQTIDLDIKDAIQAARLKNHIFERLHKCNWFLGVAFSSSGKGLHVWTKICVPEDDDIAKKKLLYMINFRHKYSYVYLALMSATELFNFSKDDILKWMDLSMGRPQQGSLLGYDKDPRINSGFFEDFIYVNFDNVKDIGHPDIDWVTYPDLKEIFKRWEWFEDEDGTKDDLAINVVDKEGPENPNDVIKVHYKHFERWRLANTLVRLFDTENNYQNGYRYLRMICSNAIKDKELLADCITAARHKKPIDPWAVQRLNSQHGFKIKLKITDDSFDGSEILSSAEQAGNPTLIRESPRRIDFHLTKDEYLGHIRNDILNSTTGITLLEAGPGLGKTEMVKQLVRDGKRIVMVMPFTSTIKSKVENDDKWYFSYGNRKPRLDAAPGLALTIDKFSRMSIMDIKTAGYDYIFIDESHLMFLSEYRPIMSKVVDLIKNSEVPIIMMSGTPCGELVFFPDATHIHVVKDDNRKKVFRINMVESPSDLMFHMCRQMAKDIVEKRRILFPTNAGTLYSKQIEAAVNYFLRNDHQIFEPINLKYYKKANIGEQFMDDVNFEKTIKDVQILLCSNYLSVGVDVLDRFEFSIYFADLILPHEIDQFCNRLRKNDLYANLYVAKNDAEGNTRSLSKYKPLNFKLNDDEITTVHSILQLCNDMIARNPIEYKYNSLISSIIYDNKYIEYNNVENKYFLNETAYKVIQFERKYRDYAQQLPIIIAGMKAYGYTAEQADLGSFVMEDALFANLKDMVKLAYDEGLQLNTQHIEELINRIHEQDLSHYQDILRGKYTIVKGDKWEDDKNNRKLTVKNVEVFEKVVPIFMSLSKLFDVKDIRDIFQHCKNSGGTFNFAAIGRIRMLVNILYNDENGRLDLPIKEFMVDSYKFAEQGSCTTKELEGFLKGFTMKYLSKASTETIIITRAETAVKDTIKAFEKIFKSLIKVSRPKKGQTITMERAELLWKRKSNDSTTGEDGPVFILEDFLNIAKEHAEQKLKEKTDETDKSTTIEV
jgi:hypothetical protein